MKSNCLHVNLPWRFRMKCLVAFAALAAAGCAEFADIAEAVDDMRVVARVGVVAHPEIGSQGAEARLQKALAHFRFRKVDAIVLLGDLTKDGYLNQYRRLSAAWDKVFNDPTKGVDANPPRRICILGPNDRRNYCDAFADELGGAIFDEGEFDVRGFRFKVQCGRPASGAGGDAVVPVVFAEGKPALTDELCFYPRESASVNAGSLSGVVPKPGYEPVAKAAAASQGLLLSAYSGKVVVSRLDFAQDAPVDAEEAARARAKRIPYAEKVAADWVIPLERGVVATPLPGKAPRFWDDARLMVARGMSGDVAAFKVAWPPVLAKYTGERALSYEVEALLDATADGKGSAVKRFHVLSPGFHLSEERDSSPAFCNFYATDFHPGARVRFAVTPVSSTGVRGPRLVSDEFLVQ